LITMEAAFRLMRLQVYLEWYNYKLHEKACSYSIYNLCENNMIAKRFESTK